jgi:hypothetical protein
MRAALLIALAATALTVAACDDGGATKTAEAPAPAAARPPPPPAPPPPMPGLSAPFATEAEWVAACTAAPLDKTICECAGKAAVKEAGEKSLYTWVWEGYIQRVGMGKIRSDKWFADNGIDKAGQQKFADAIGKCYVSK